MEATPLIVEQVNDIIRDAKSIIEGDPYLDRVKEFVPAGNNPTYPDVLLVARSVQTSMLFCSLQQPWPPRWQGTFSHHAAGRAGRSRSR